MRLHGGGCRWGAGQGVRVRTRGEGEELGEGVRDGASALPDAPHCLPSVR